MQAMKGNNVYYTFFVVYELKWTGAKIHAKTINLKTSLNLILMILQKLILFSKQKHILVLNPLWVIVSKWFKRTFYNSEDWTQKITIVCIAFLRLFFIFGFRLKTTITCSTHIGSVLFRLAYLSSVVKSLLTQFLSKSKLKIFCWKTFFFKWDLNVNLFAASLVNMTLALEPCKL